MKSHQEVVSGQFGATAATYLSSAVHAQGQDLVDLADFAARRPGARILDMGCGAGHASFAVAPQAETVVAYDLSGEMLAVVDQAARTRGLAAIETRRGSVDALPFPDAAFDLIVTRYSAHHWVNLDAALSEMARVLKPGGQGVFIDTVAPADTLSDTWMQSMELLRDPSHVRNRTADEWKGLLAAYGMQSTDSRVWKIRLEFASWVARMRTPQVQADAIRALQAVAPQEVRQQLGIEADGSFSIDTAWIGFEKAR